MLNASAVETGHLGGVATHGTPASYVSTALTGRDEAPRPAQALVISPQPFFTPRGTPFSVYYRTKAMAESGVRIDLLTYGEGQDVDIPGVRIVRIPHFALLGPVRVGPSALKLFLDVFLAAWTVALLLRHRYRLICAHEESVFFCRFLKPIFRFRLIYDMHSSLPRQLTQFRFSRWRPLIALFEKLEATCLKNADVVITVCPELSRYAEPRTGENTRHVLIENTVFDDVRLRQDSPVDDSGGGHDDGGGHWETALPRDRPIVAYAGNFECYQGIDLLLEAFAVARRQRHDACLLLIGGTEKQVAHYQETAENLGVADDCLFTGRLKPSTLGPLLRRSTLVTSPRMGDSFTPLKIYRHLAEGPALVATRIPAHTQVLDDELCFLADPSPEGLAQSLLEALGDETRRIRVAAAARARYENDYSSVAYLWKVRSTVEAVRPELCEAAAAMPKQG